MKGRFITFEGIDGCGKTTQIELLAKNLQLAGYKVLKTREPGGTSISEKIRELLLDHRNEEMVATTELLLYAAARAQHVEEVIMPALKAGKIVLCDRFIDSTLAYQGYGRHLAKDLLKDLARIAVGELKIDVTLFIDIPVEVSIARLQSQEENALDRMEKMDVVFYESVRQGYLKMAKNIERIKTLDGCQKVGSIEKNILTEIKFILNGDR